MKICSSFSKLSIVLLFATTYMGEIRASEGTLDPSFGIFGVTIGPLGAGVQAVAVQTDGYIVAAGVNSSNTEGQIVRYTPDGKVDMSFGGGIVIQPGIQPTDLIIQPDGKILVIGFTNGATQNVLLIRYNKDGSPDLSFGNGSIASFSQQLGSPFAVILQADQHILTSGVDSANQFVQVLRFTPTGALETIFTPFATVGGIGASGIVIQTDGKIVVGNINALSKMQLSRYNPDGTPDFTYGVNGVAIVPIAPAMLQTGGIALQADGKVIISATLAAGLGTIVARFDSNGTLDPSYGNMSFGVAGVFQSSTSGTVQSITLQPDNKTVLAGLDGSQTTSQIERVTSTGAVDMTWNGTGFNFNPLAGAILGSTLQANGYSLAAGTNTNFTYFQLARYISSAPFLKTSITNPTTSLSSVPGSITFTGHAQSPSFVYLLVDGIVVAGTQTDQNSWSITTAITTPGRHTVQAVSIYQNKKLNMISEPIIFCMFSSSVSPLVQAIISKYCCH